MTDIPKDIMEAALNAWVKVPSNDYEIDEGAEVIARAILAERNRCKAGIDEAIREGMACIADELAEPCAETVEMVARAICTASQIDPDRKGNETEWRWQEFEKEARSAITAVRGAFFSSTPHSHTATE